MFGQSLVSILVSICVALLPLPALAADYHHEPHYSAQWCEARGGEAEVVLDSGTRVDCLTETHAIEAEWAHGRRWRTGIGQSLDYAQETGKRAGIVLLLRGNEDYRHWIRLNTVIDYHGLPIDTWRVEVRPK